MVEEANKATIKQDDFIVETPVVIEETITKGDKTYIKKYERGKFLGKGGFAKCYEMRDVEACQSYAAKVFEKRNLNNEKSKKKLVNEIKLHKKLRHQNIVNFEHFFEDKENVYILLDLCTNQTLNELLKRRKRMTEIETQCLILQIAKALRYIHQHKIVHRDLKLGNCFLTSNLEVKLGDFGLAAKLEFEGQKRKTVCGTPNYIAPEVLEKKGHSYEIDVWSLGVVTFTLLFGKPPFETNDVKLTYKKIKMGSFTYPESIKVNPSAKQLITAMLQVDPAKRITLENIINHEFFKIYQSIPATLPNSSLICAPSKVYLSHYVKNQGSQINLNYNNSSDTIDAGRNHRKSDSCFNIQSNLSKDNNNNSGTNLGNENKINEKFSTLHEINALINSNADGPLSARIEGSQNIINNNYFINFGNLNNIEFKFEDNLLNNEVVVQKNDQNERENAIVTEKLKNQPKIAWYIDYTSKFGILYIISKRSVGISFHDFSNLIRNYNIKGDNYKYLYFEKGGKNIMTFDDSSFEDFIVNKKSNRELTKKFDVFKQALMKYSAIVKEVIVEKEIVKLDFNKKNFSQNLVYVKKFFKTQNCILFRLSNKLVQVNFNDKTQLVMSTDGSYVLYKNKYGEEHVFNIVNVLKSDNAELIKRIKYTKSLLIHLVKNQKNQQSSTINN